MQKKPLLFLFRAYYGNATTILSVSDWLDALVTGCIDSAYTTWPVYGINAGLITPSTFMFLVPSADEIYFGEIPDRSEA